jgi:oligoribonuclease
LTERVLTSKNSTAEVEEDLLKYVGRYVAKGEGYLAGSCVYADREFMRYEFPRVIDYLHWRLVGLVLFCGWSLMKDVSTIRFLSGKWEPGLGSAAPPRKKDHRAMEDIKESIEELRYYKKSLWKATED